MGAGSPFPVVIVMRSRPAVSRPSGLPGMTTPFQRAAWRLEGARLTATYGNEHIDPAKRTNRFLDDAIGPERYANVAERMISEA